MVITSCSVTWITQTKVTVNTAECVSQCTACEHQVHHTLDVTRPPCPDIERREFETPVAAKPSRFKPCHGGVHQTTSRRPIPLARLSASSAQRTNTASRVYTTRLMICRLLSPCWPNNLPQLEPNHSPQWVTATVPGSAAAAASLQCRQPGMAASPPLTLLSTSVQWPLQLVVLLWMGGKSQQPSGTPPSRNGCMGLQGREDTYHLWVHRCRCPG